jgi:hypothetical protein
MQRSRASFGMRTFIYSNGYGRQGLESDDLLWRLDNQQQLGVTYNVDKSAEVPHASNSTFRR